MDEFNLSDFLSTAGGAYSAYQQAQVASDNTRAAQANAAALAAQNAGNSAMSNQTKTYLVIGGGILIAIIALILVFKRK